MTVTTATWLPSDTTERLDSALAALQDVTASALQIEQVSDVMDAAAFTRFQTTIVTAITELYGAADHLEAVTARVHDRLVSDLAPSLEQLRSLLGRAQSLVVAMQSPEAPTLAIPLTWRETDASYYRDRPMCIQDGRVIHPPAHEEIVSRRHGQRIGTVRVIERLGTPLDDFGSALDPSGILDADSFAAWSEVVASPTQITASSACAWLNQTDYTSGAAVQLEVDFVHPLLANYLDLTPYSRYGMTVLAIDAWSSVIEMWIPCWRPAHGYLVDDVERYALSVAGEGGISEYGVTSEKFRITLAQSHATLQPQTITMAQLATQQYWSQLLTSDDDALARWERWSTIVSARLAPSARRGIEALGAQLSRIEALLTALATDSPLTIDSSLQYVYEYGIRELRFLYLAGEVTSRFVSAPLPLAGTLARAKIAVDLACSNAMSSPLAVRTSDADGHITAELLLREGDSEPVQLYPDTWSDIELATISVAHYPEIPVLLADDGARTHAIVPSGIATFSANDQRLGTAPMTFTTEQSICLSEDGWAVLSGPPVSVYQYTSSWNLVFTPIFGMPMACHSLLVGGAAQLVLVYPDRVATFDTTGTPLEMAESAVEIVASAAFDGLCLCGLAGGGYAIFDPVAGTFGETQACPLSEPTPITAVALIGTTPVLGFATGAVAVASDEAVVLKQGGAAIDGLISGASSVCVQSGGVLRWYTADGVVLREQTGPWAAASATTGVLMDGTIHQLDSLAPYWTIADGLAPILCEEIFVDPGQMLTLSKWPWLDWPGICRYESARGYAAEYDANHLPSPVVRPIEVSAALDGVTVPQDATGLPYTASHTVYQTIPVTVNSYATSTRLAAMMPYVLDQVSVLDEVSEGASLALMTAYGLHGSSDAITRLSQTIAGRLYRSRIVPWSALDDRCTIGVIATHSGTSYLYTPAGATHRVVGLPALLRTLPADGLLAFATPLPATLTIITNGVSTTVTSTDVTLVAYDFYAADASRYPVRNADGTIEMVSAPPRTLPVAQNVTDYVGGSIAVPHAYDPLTYPILEYRQDGNQIFFGAPVTGSVTVRYWSYALTPRVQLDFTAEPAIAQALPPGQVPMVSALSLVYGYYL